MKTWPLIATLALLSILFSFESQAQSSNRAYAKNYISISNASGEYYYYTSLYDPYSGYYSNAVYDVYYAPLISYARRFTKNLYACLGTMKFDDENRVFMFGMKSNFIVHRRLQPTLRIDLITPAGDTSAQLPASGGLDFHIGQHFVLSTMGGLDLINFTPTSLTGLSFKF